MYIYIPCRSILICGVNLTNMDVSKFVPEESPLDALPRFYEPWENIVRQLPKLIKDGKLRETVADLQILPVSHSLLPTNRHWQRAYSVLTFISQGYLFENVTSVVDTLPKQLAIPWVEVSRQCGLPPVTTYAAVVLWNWKLINPNKPPSLDNVRALFTYTGTHAEEWFYIVHLAIELAAAPGIKSANECYEAISKEDSEKVVASLNAVASSIVAMIELIKKMRDGCTPEEFFHSVRIWQSGSESDMFPNGLKYESAIVKKFDDKTIREDCMKFSGASAVQSSIMPAYDILLGIQHTESNKDFLELQRWHMPLDHRQYLLEKSQLKSARDYVLQKKANVNLVDAYNNCITEIANFRKQHIQLVTSYIINQLPQSDDDGDQARGTGGSLIMEFLKRIRDHVIEHELK